MRIRLNRTSKNVAELVIGNYAFLFSYSTLVGMCVDSGFIVPENRVSVTTSRHINQWLSGARPETLGAVEWDSAVRFNLSQAINSIQSPAPEMPRDPVGDCAFCWPSPCPATHTKDGRPICDTCDSE